LKGRFHWYKLSPQNYQTALDYFSLALEKDPECALAYAGISMVWMARGYWGLIPPHESMPEAKSMALKAIELDDTLEEAHDALARILYFYDWDWAGAEKEFKQAIQFNPNKADVHIFYSAFLRSIGKGEQAMTESKIGLELDPLNFFSQSAYTGHLMYLQKYDEAILKLRKILILEPDCTFAHRYLWICYHQKQLYDDAIHEAQNFFAAVGKNEFSEILANAYSNSNYENALQLLAETFEEHRKSTYIQSAWIARLYSYSGDKDRALDWLETAYGERDALMTNLQSSNDWDILRYEERFKRLVNRMNFPG
jgi:serine/threonine-protein kinase